MRAKSSASRFLVVLSIVIIVLMLIVSATYPVSSKWSSSGSSGDVVQVTGTYTSYRVTTNAQGQTVTTAITTTGAYVTSATATATSQYVTTIVTTSAASTITTTSTSLGDAWLNIAISGLFKLLDPNGNPTQSQTFEIEPWAGGGEADSIALDANYQVAGNGIDWSTLKVDCSSSGLTAQPTVADPTQSEIVNQGKLKEWTGQTSSTGQLKLTSKINDLTANKAWDHNRKLTAAIGVICTATAKKLAGYELAGGGETVQAVVGPVVAQTHLKWKQPPAPVTTAVAPTEGLGYRPPAEPPPTYTPTTPPPNAPSTPPKTAKQTCEDAGGTMTGYGYCATGGAKGVSFLKTTTTTPIDVSEKVSKWYESPLHPVFQLLGLSTVEIQIYGAETQYPLHSAVFPVVATMLGLAVIFILLRKKRRRI